jgi:uncharacterized protein with FMN-binding domain
MRKYLQITFFLGVFGLLVLLRQVKGNDVPAIGQKNIINQTPTSVPSSGASSSMMQTQMGQTPGAYKDGTYTGSVQDAFYGNIQAQAVISGGKITDVVFLQYPNDNRTSQYINSVADPMLKQEAIQAQSAQVNIISGASASSQAFQVSLADALSQAK